MLRDLRQYAADHICDACFTDATSYSWFVWGDRLHRSSKPSKEDKRMEDIDLTMLAYRAILRTAEPETVKEVVPMTAQKD